MKKGPSSSKSPSGPLEALLKSIPPDELKLMVPPSDSRAVAVYCAASLGKRKAFQNAALSVGHALAEANRPLIYGGGNAGIMGVVSGAALEHENAKVIGIIPNAILAGGGEKDKGGNPIPTTKHVADALSEKPRVAETIVVSSMHERKVEMATRVGGFIGLPGGFGTFDEVLEVITWNQLNIHNKPVVLLNVCGYWSPLRALVRTGIEEGFIRPENEKLVIFVDGPEDYDKHETFEWGKAAIAALESWDTANTKGTLPFHWLKDVDTSAATTNEKPTKGSSSARWLRKVWHARMRGRPLVVA